MTSAEILREFAANGVAICERGALQAALLDGTAALDRERWKPISEYDEQKHGEWVMLPKRNTVTIAKREQEGVWDDGFEEIWSPTRFRELPEPPKEPTNAS